MTVRAPIGKDRQVVYRVPAGRFGVNVAVMTEARFGHPPVAMVEIVDRSTDEVVQRPIAYPDGGDGREAGDGRGPADREERPGRGRASEDA